MNNTYIYIIIQNTLFSKIPGRNFQDVTCFKKQKKKRKSPIKDWRKGKRENPQSKIEGKQEKEKIPDQRSEESKREIDRKVVGLDNVQSCYKQERNE